MSYEDFQQQKTKKLYFRINYGMTLPAQTIQNVVSSQYVNINAVKNRLVFKNKSITNQFQSQFKYSKKKIKPVRDSLQPPGNFDACFAISFPALLYTEVFESLATTRHLLPTGHTTISQFCSKSTGLSSNHSENMSFFKSMQ